ncbi:imidazolonepropionase [Paraflavisolibacter sp. H34]|uniref:imidazolonepropionase n=1 Tax=Huijunlia imazamoxiresistens TaxID=3127457 RepID=UPI003018963A
MTTLISDIKSLVNVRQESTPLRGRELAHLPCLDNAYLIVEDGVIAAFGSMETLPYPPGHFQQHIHAAKRLLLPCWCDSHTHLVFAGSREEEFVDRLKGLSYAEIAARGGGILNSAARLNATSEDELFRQSWQRLQEVIAQGTGAIEIKSGYGLTVEGELKMLRVIRRLRQKASIPIKATFLGAHSIPRAYQDNRQGYIDLLLNDMLPQVAAERLADYIDVFCEEGFFTPEETEQICRAGLRYGLKPKIHANQLHASGGVQAGVRLGAVSVDHLECMDDAAIAALSGSATVGTLLPTAAFFLRMPYQPARELLERNCALALASDYNPGSSPSGNMNFVVALSCIQMRLLPEEAVNAATHNGACAMEVQQEVGSIALGKKANLMLTRPLPSLAFLPYAFGSNLIEQVLINGEGIG